MLRRQGARARLFHLTPHRCDCSIPGSPQVPGGPTSPDCPSLVPSGRCLPSGFWHFFFLHSVLALHTLGQEEHPRLCFGTIPNFRPGAHSAMATLYFFSCFPIFFAIGLSHWAMVITGAIWAGFSMLLSKQLVTWCLTMGCPAMYPTPRMALTLPGHSIEGKTSLGLGSDCSALHTPQVPWDLKATRFPWAVQLRVPQTWTLQTDVPKVTNATRALCLAKWC